MSVGNDLQEMEVSTKKSTSAVNKGATSGEGMHKATIPGEGLVNSVEDLGGPTPQNSKPTDDSNKYKTPAAKLSAVRDVQHRSAKSPDPMQHANKAAWSYEETESDDENLVLESEEAEEEIEETEEDVVEEEISLEEKIDNIINSEVDYTTDINALSEGEDLSEEFAVKAATIFEAAVKSKVISAVEVMQEEYQKNLVEEVTAIKEELTERVDSYLEYVAQQWIEENSIQIESGIKGEISESFMSKLKGLFEEHYVEMPEDKYNVLEGMVERLDEMEEKLNEQIERNVQLNRRLSEAVSDSILNDVSEGLALTQKEKLASLAESVEFNGEEDYREKLVTLKEAYFPTRNSVSAREEVLVEQAYEDYTPQMSAYLRAVNKFSK